MPPRNWRMRLQDILECIDRIEQYTHGMDFVQFHNSEKTLDAVIYNFAVIGEAARHVPSEVTDRYPQVPWMDMRDMRNLVIHEYSAVDPRILWDTIKEDLPPLTPLLRDMLENEP